MARTPGRLNRLESQADPIPGLLFGRWQVFGGDMNFTKPVIISALYPILEERSRGGLSRCAFICYRTGPTKKEDGYYVGIFREEKAMPGAGWLG